MEVASHEGKSRKVTRAKDVPVGDSQYSDPPAAIAVSDGGGRPELPSISDREGRKGRCCRRRDVTARHMPDMLSALLAGLLEVSRSKGFAMRRGQMAPSPRCGIRTSGGDLTGSADDMATLPDGPRPRRYELVAACRVTGTATSDCDGLTPCVRAAVATRLLHPSGPPGGPWSSGPAPSTMALGCPRHLGKRPVS